ncbi:MAG: TetR/AcrR family transcriptional regulator, partial [Deltaproteobacteria bacterium]|nr:TetR/AcrR family transcriptional regulator [Deltaproteobacteria bacterium]
MQTKKAIIEFASDLFLRYGLRKTTMDDVARICRIGKATLYKFFRNKEELYREILRNEMNQIFEEMERKIKNIKGVRERLVVLFETEYILLRKNMNLPEILVSTFENIDIEIKEIADEFFERQRKLIRSVLEEGVKRGEIVVEDLSLLSLAMMAAGQGLFSYFRNIKDERKAIRSMEYLI